MNENTQIWIAESIIIDGYKIVNKQIKMNIRLNKYEVEWMNMNEYKVK